MYLLGMPSEFGFAIFAQLVQHMQCKHQAHPNIHVHCNPSTGTVMRIAPALSASGFARIVPTRGGILRS